MKGTKLDFYRHNMRSKFRLFAEKPQFIGFYIDRARKYSDLKQFPLIIVSYPKSGRTWLQKLVIEAVRLDMGVSEEISDISQLSKYVELPKILSTHAGSSWEERVKNHDEIKTKDWQKYAHAKVLFLYRDPRDILVSQFYHIRHRSGYANFDQDYMVQNKNVGLLKIINFMNKWKSYGAQNPDSIMELSYEDMKSDAIGALTKILEFWDLKISPDLIAQAVENCSLENMRKKEAANTETPWTMTKESSNNNAFHSRKGIVGEYKEFFQGEEIATINRMISDHLDPSFGY